jgi:hypothetical protein
LLAIPLSERWTLEAAGEAPETEILGRLVYLRKRGRLARRKPR